jgi:hypothetical protein
MAANVPALRDQLMGAWELVEYSAFPIDDPSKKIFPMGKDAQGIIMYTHNGYMSAQIQVPGQKPFQSNDLNGHTTEELAESAKNYFAYTGPFYLDEAGDEPILMHHMTLSLLPNWLGNTQRRLMKISKEGDDIYLTLGPEAPVEIMGEKRMSKLIWRRSPDNLVSHP